MGTFRGDDGKEYEYWFEDVDWLDREWVEQNPADAAVYACGVWGVLVKEVRYEFLVQNAKPRPRLRYLSLGHTVEDLWDLLSQEASLLKVFGFVSLKQATDLILSLMKLGQELSSEWRSQAPKDEVENFNLREYAKANLDDVLGTQEPSDFAQFLSGQERVDRRTFASGMEQLMNHEQQ